MGTRRDFGMTAADVGTLSRWQGPLRVPGGDGRGGFWGRDDACAGLTRPSHAVPCQTARAPMSALQGTGRGQGWPRRWRWQLSGAGRVHEVPTFGSRRARTAAAQRGRNQTRLRKCPTSQRDAISDAGGGSQRDSQSSMSSASPHVWKGAGVCHISLSVLGWVFALLSTSTSSNLTYCPGNPAAELSR